MRDVKFGVQLSARHYTPEDWDALKSITLYCEGLGYDSVWFGDHLTTGGSRLECWTILSALSTITHRIRLGSMVLCNNFRNPALLAKMAATLDVISKGRMEFGIGAGWHKEEHEAYGFAFPEPRIRIDMLREGLEIIKRMWTEDKPSYKGKHYWIKEATCEPRPLQKPRPPITIGGGGERYTLKLVAAHADRWNFRESAEQYQRKWGILEKYCSQIGRNPQEIEKSYFSSMEVYPNEGELMQTMKEVYSMDYNGRPQIQTIPFEEWLNRFRSAAIVGTSEECLKKIREFMDIGITHFIFRSPRQLPNLMKMRESLKLFAEDVISQIRTE